MNGIFYLVERVFLFILLKGEILGIIYIDGMDSFFWRFLDKIVLIRSLVF